MDQHAHLPNDRAAPTLIEVWAPWCPSCAAMEADLDDVAREFDGRVVLEQVDASAAPGRARDLHVLATPTLIGMRDGVEVFRLTGQASRQELEEIFTALERDPSPKAPVRRNQTTLSAVAGMTLLCAGLLTGPSIPLALIGAGLLSAAILPYVRRSRANRS